MIDKAVFEEWHQHHMTREKWWAKVGTTQRREAAANKAYKAARAEYKAARAERKAAYIKFYEARDEKNKLSKRVNAAMIAAGLKHILWGGFVFIVRDQCWGAEAREDMRKQQASELPE